MPRKTNDQPRPEAREDKALRTRLAGFEERWESYLAAADQDPVKLALKDPIDGPPLTVRLDAVGITSHLFPAMPIWL